MLNRLAKKSLAKNAANKDLYHLIKPGPCFNITLVKMLKLGCDSF